jgi:hypothetical protein
MKEIKLKIKNNLASQVDSKIANRTMLFLYDKIMLPVDRENSRLFFKIVYATDEKIHNE